MDGCRCFELKQRCWMNWWRRGRDVEEEEKLEWKTIRFRVQLRMEKKGTILIHWHRMRSIARIFNTSMRGTRHKHKHNKNVYYIEFAIYRNGCKDVFFCIQFSTILLKFRSYWNLNGAEKKIVSEWMKKIPPTKTWDLSSLWCRRMNWLNGDKREIKK